MQLVANMIPFAAPCGGVMVFVCPREHRFNSALPTYESFVMGQSITLSNAVDEGKGYSEFTEGKVRKLWVWGDS